MAPLCASTANRVLQRKMSPLGNQQFALNDHPTNDVDLRNVVANEFTLKAETIHVVVCTIYQVVVIVSVL